MNTIAAKDLLRLCPLFHNSRYPCHVYKLLGMLVYMSPNTISTSYFPETFLVLKSK